MKAFMIVIVVIVTAVVINWVRCGDAFALPQALPFLGGKDPGVYDLGACGLLLLCLWGIIRLRRRDADNTDATPGDTSDYETINENEDSYGEEDDDN
jgi:hypothetical protein